MRAFIIGATGFVGAAVARRFKVRGWAAHGLARSVENRAALAAAGVTPVDGDLRDLERLKRIAAGFDVTVYCAMIPLEDELPIMAALVEALSGSGRRLVFTSGTGVLSIDSPDGLWDENVFAEDDPFPFPDRDVREMRMRTEVLVRRAADEGVNAVVIRPPLIYGNGGGKLIPMMFETAKRTGYACYLGRGLNVFSNVHVDDVAEVYALAIEQSRPGGLYHAVAGEANYRSIAEAVATVAGCGARSVGYEEACALWGRPMVHMAFAVNSRSRAPRARSELGWRPSNLDLVEDIRIGSYSGRHVSRP
jgi:nucleoside-diphosphate-sugar epimerase